MHAINRPTMSTHFELTLLTNNKIVLCLNVNDKEWVWEENHNEQRERKKGA